MTKKNIKIICGLSVIVFALLVFIVKLKWLDALSYAVSTAAILDYLYDRCLWRYNPLEKTPRLYGVYDVLFLSNYQGGTAHPAVAIIKQTLSHISIFERSQDGHSFAITTSLTQKGSEDNPWYLYYIYQAESNSHPDSSDHDDAHSGTALLCIADDGSLDGPYYTNRLIPTKGRLIMVRRKDPSVACPLNPRDYEKHPELIDPVET